MTRFICSENGWWGGDDVGKQLQEVVDLYQYIQCTDEFRSAATKHGINPSKIKLLLNMDWSATHSCYAADARVVGRLQVGDIDLSARPAIEEGGRVRMKDKWKVGADVILKAGDIGPNDPKYRVGEVYKFREGHIKKGGKRLCVELGWWCKGMTWTGGSKKVTIAFISTPTQTIPNEY